MSALGLEATYVAIHEGVVGTVAPVEVVRVSGPDAHDYLQGQVSQDLDTLGPGGAVETLILSPQGKLDAFCRVARDADDGLFVVVADGYGAEVLERLRRFKVRVKAELELLTWRVAQLRGPGVANLDAVHPGALVLTVDYPGLVGRDLVGADISLPDDVSEGDPSAFETARIEAGVPAMGHEISERTIPQETGIVERTVSFTKGCYTGQELVARIDARGNRVPRRLVGFEIAGDAQTGDVVMSGEREVGTLTSVAVSPRTGGLVALGYLRRDVDVPAQVEVAGASARASALPLYPT